MRALTRTMVFVALVGLGACSDDQQRSPLELTAGDACGDAYFWATTGSGSVAVTVRIDARDRSTTEVTTEAFTLPDPAVEVEVLEGRDLGRNFCNDVIDTASEPRARQGAVAGEGTITLDPALEGLDPFGCGSISGQLDLTGLEAEDGTTFAPIRVSSDSIGCYAG